MLIRFQHYIRNTVIKLIKEINPDFNPNYTKIKEVNILCSFAIESNGNILEIGCNEGDTTRELANACPDKLILASDIFAQKTTLKYQQYEVPKKNRICIRAKNYENVIVIDANSKDYESMLKKYNLKFVFVDGDHSFEGVKKDTEMLLRILEKGSIIAWHDYYDDAPDWVGVKKYLDKYSGLKVIKIPNTNIAWYQI